MNKKQLVDAVAGKTAMNRSSAAQTVDALLEVVVASLTDGESVALPGFGMFEVRNRRWRSGRNPQTGETITIAESRVPAFKPSKALRNAVN